MEAETLILSEKQKLEREAAEIGVKCFNSFYFFFKTFWAEMSGERYIDNWHIKYICDVLQEKGMMIVREEVIRETLIINVPPGSSKSTMCTVAFPLWMWLHKPSCTTVNVSFSATLSADHQELSKAIPCSDKWSALFDNLLILKYGKKITLDASNKNKIQNNFKGKRFNSAVTGVTGKHADIIIEDDPLNPEQAFSDTERATAIRVHDQTISSRIKNDNCYLNIIIAQRLHEEDVCGHVLNQNIPMTHICFPGELTSSTTVVPKECEQFYVDGILNPVRKGRAVLDIAKTKMGAGYVTQILQMPFSLEEQDIKPSMFEILPAVRDDIVWDLWIDGAFSEKTKNDPSGIDLIAKVGNDIIVKHSYDVRKKLPDLLAFIVELETTGQFDKQKSRIFIEPKASGTPLADYIEHDTDYNFVRIGEDNKVESKLIQGGHIARHEMIKPKAVSRRIKLVQGNWNTEYTTQICGFPKAAHDEHVDNLGYAINHYYMQESTFVEDWAIRKLEKVVPGSIDVLITSQIIKNKFSADYAESSKGDVQLFEDPNKLYHYRYICVAVLRSEGDRGGKTVIQVLDRLTMQIVAYYESDDITPQKTGKKAIEMASLFDNAKLAIAVHKEIGNAQSEENDLSHIALAEVRKVKYENIYSRLTQNDIKKKREREYGFEVNRSTTREVYYNLKEKLETNKLPNVPLEVLSEIKLLERKKEDGSVNAREGYQSNAVLNYSIALKIHDEMYDKPKVKKSDRWIN
jgi:phage terminase large subunit-like protein